MHIGVFSAMLGLLPGTLWACPPPQDPPPWREVLKGEFEFAHSVALMEATRVVKIRPDPIKPNVGIDRVSMRMIRLYKGLPDDVPKVDEIVRDMNSCNKEPGWRKGEQMLVFFSPRGTAHRHFDPSTLDATFQALQELKLIEGR